MGTVGDVPLCNGDQPLADNHVGALSVGRVCGSGDGVCREPVRGAAFEVMRGWGYNSTSLWAMEKRASSRRVETPVLSKTFDRWRFTVSSLMVNCLAMSRFEHPSTMQVTTSSSRGVRP